MTRINRFFRLLLFTFLVLALTGACGYRSYKEGVAVDTGGVEKKLVVGKTTKQEVLLGFGVPTRTLDNDRIFFYTWTEGSKAKVWVYKGTSADTYSLMVLFDEGGIVKDYKITKTGAESQKSLFGGTD
ncbi:MAG: hypothetical protein PHY31_04445 [Smithellaceae bacterium]|nr:hypothetical protein [Smithellaceae bacterium]